MRIFSYHFQLSLFILLVPLPCLALVRYILGNTGGLSGLFFFPGLVLEFAFFIYLYFLYDSGRINHRKLIQGEYLLRSVLGLPLTIYFTIAAPFGGFCALLRFLATLLILTRGTALTPPVFYSLFYTAGLLVFSALQSSGPPRPIHFLVALAAALMGTLISGGFFWERKNLLAAKKSERDNKRTRRRLGRLEKRETEYLSRVLPEFQVRNFREERKLVPEEGIYLLVCLSFSGVDQSLDYYRKSRTGSHRDVLLEFEEEWNRYLEYILRQLRAVGMTGGAHGDFWFFGRSLDLREAPANDILREKFQADIFPVIFQLDELLRFTERSRRALESRGQKGWYLEGAISLGPAVGMSQGGGNPGWTFRGDLARRMREFLARRAPEDSPTRWIGNELAPLLSRVYQSDSVRRLSDWHAPEFLLAEFSEEGRGLLPGSDFYDRIKYNPSR